MYNIENQPDLSSEFAVLVELAKASAIAERIQETARCDTDFAVICFGVSVHTEISMLPGLVCVLLAHLAPLSLQCYRKKNCI